MKLIVITEGGRTGGLGHIQRCLAISQAFEEKGVRSEFIVHGDNSIKEVLKGRKHRIFNWLKERDKVFALIGKTDIVILDSYQAGIGFYKGLSVLARVPVYIDDNKRLDYPRGIVVNGGIHAGRLAYPKRNNIKYLLGHRYAPLRKLFWEVKAREMKDDIESIMVTTGGHDPLNVMPKVVGFLGAHYPDLRKYIIIGNSFNNLDEIRKQADKRTKLIYCPDTRTMKKIMLRSDIAISSGGQTVYELARVGVPTIAFCLAENQRLNLEAWEKQGFVEYAGTYDHFERKISQGLDKLSLKKERARRIRVGMRLIDGQGSRRIVEFLKEKGKYE